MAFARWDLIAQRILNNIQDAGIRNFNRERILTECTTIEQNVARDGLALQGSDTIDTVIGTGSYPIAAPAFRIKQIFRPADWCRPIQIVINSKKWEEITAAANHRTGGTQPLFVTVWKGSVLFLPVPADVQTVNLWTYIVPTAVPDFGADPSLAVQWDDALVYGCTERLISTKDVKAAMNWSKRYTDEVQSQAMRDAKGGILAPLQIEHSSRRLGF